MAPALQNFRERAGRHSCYSLRDHICLHEPKANKTQPGRGPRTGRPFRTLFPNARLSYNSRRKGFAFRWFLEGMGRPSTLLEGLCGHALSLGAQSIEVKYKDGRGWVFAHEGGIGISIANYKSSSADGKELRGNLYAAARKPVRTVIGGQVHILRVRIYGKVWRGCLPGQHRSGAEGRSVNSAVIQPKSRVNIWRSSTTTRRSTARLPRNWICSATSGFLRPRFTI